MTGSRWRAMCGRGCERRILGTGPRSHETARVRWCQTQSQTCNHNEGVKLTEVTYALSAGRRPGSEQCSSQRQSHAHASGRARCQKISASKRMHAPRVCGVHGERCRRLLRRQGCCRYLDERPCMLFNLLVPGEFCAHFPITRRVPGGCQPTIARVHARHYQI